MHRLPIGILTLAVMVACGGSTDPAPGDVLPDSMPDVAGLETDFGDHGGVDVPDAAEDALHDAVGDDGEPADVPADEGRWDPPPPPFDPPECGSLAYDWRSLVPGPGQEGFDADLEAKATRIEKQFQTFNAAAMGVNTDVSVALDRTEDRTAIEDFILLHDGWDFEAFAGKPPLDALSRQNKVAGLYAGAGVAADAFRYGVLRDQGYPCDEIELARGFLESSLDTLHTAVAITGAPGVIVRGLARTDLPGDGQVATLPLFDDQGNPLPLVKNNGAWREDFSGGEYPNLIWEDSVSRDMYIGWVAGYASAWEVIRDDPAFDSDVKARLRDDALAVARQLMVVRPSGYDLELPDADGRTTLHGWLNEHNLDGFIYDDSIRNGFHSIMALGVVAAWVYVTEDPELTSWLYDELIGERRIHEIFQEEGSVLLDAGLKSNYSNYNMAFTGAWLAMRYLKDLAAREAVREGLDDQMYARPGKDRQPEEIGYSFYDFIFAGGMADQNAWGPMFTEPDPIPVEKGLVTLRDFADAPRWNHGVVNCPAAVCDCNQTSVDSSECIASDGTTALTVLGCIGRNCDLVTQEPLPMRILGPSNYHWRSNPYGPNREGDGSALLPSVDFRIAYWMGRWFRRP
jgi:hypothetical protein